MSDPHHSQLYIYPRYEQLYKFSNHSSQHYNNFIINQPVIFYFLLGCIGLVVWLKCLPMCFRAWTSVYRIEQEPRITIEDNISESEDTDQDEENYVPPQPIQLVQPAILTQIGDVQINIVPNINENSEDENSEDLPTYSELYAGK